MKWFICLTLLLSATVIPNLSFALDIKCDRRIESSDPWEIDDFKYQFKLENKVGAEIKAKVFFEGQRIKEFLATTLKSESGEVARYLIQQTNESPVTQTRLIFDVDVRECTTESWGRLVAKRVGSFTDSTQILDWNVPCLCEE